MSERRISVRISPIGNAVVEAQGFNGMGCEAATSPIERALSGGNVETRVTKPEFYQDESEQQEQHLSW